MGKKAKGQYFVIDLLRVFEGSLLMTQACFCRLGDNQHNSCWGLLSRHVNVWELWCTSKLCIYGKLIYFWKTVTCCHKLLWSCSYLCKVGVSHCVMLSCVTPTWQKYKEILWYKGKPFRKVYIFLLGIDSTVLKERAVLFIACAFQILTVQRGLYQLFFFDALLKYIKDKREV